MSPMMTCSLPVTPEDSHDYRSLTSTKIDNHEFAIHKHRKATSTGGGRAWSEEEVIHYCLTIKTSI